MLLFPPILLEIAGRKVMLFVACFFQLPQKINFYSISKLILRFTEEEAQENKHSLLSQHAISERLLLYSKLIVFF